MSNIIDFQSKAEARRVACNIEATNAVGIRHDVFDDHQYIVELEHEILELQQQVCALHRDLERERARGHL